MKNLIRISILVIILSSLLVSCSNVEEPVYIEGEEREMVAAQAEPYAQNILDGIDQNNYELFITGFDTAMLEAMTDTQFATIEKMIGPLGQAKTIELINVVDKDTMYGINYKVTYADKKVNMLVVLTKSEPRLVSGLWFK